MTGAALPKCVECPGVIDRSRGMQDTCCQAGGLEWLCVTDTAEFPGRVRLKFLCLWTLAQTTPLLGSLVLPASPAPLPYRYLGFPVSTSWISTGIWALTLRPAFGESNLTQSSNLAHLLNREFHIPPKSSQYHSTEYKQHLVKKYKWLQMHKKTY